MKTIKEISNGYFYRAIGLIFCFLFISILNVHAQSNKDTTVHPKIIQPPPPYDPVFVPDPDTTVAYTYPDTMPKFQGNLQKYFADSIRYPEQAKEKKVGGVVYVSFVIERNGSISNIKILRSPDTTLNNEAIRVISTMPKWIPGKQDGKSVRVRYMIPIRFHLQPASSSSTIKH